MNGSPVAALVRGWVRVYTSRLPAELRDARRDEVDDDLWCEKEETQATGGSVRSLDADRVLRLLFGIPADISWRLEQRHRDRVRPARSRPSMSARVVASLSIFGGSALASASIIWGTFDWASPVAGPGRLLFVTGFVGLAIAIWALVARFNDRMAGGAALLGVIGGFGSAIAGLGAAGAGDILGAWFVLLPIGSTAMALDLSRHGTMPRNLAIVHAAAAFAVVIILFAIWTDSAVGALIYPRVPYALPWVPYAVSWIGIGVSLLRGQPEPDKPLLKPE
jgi:hypothetical protein